MKFDQKIAATRELKSGVNTTTTNVSTKTVVEPSEKAVSPEGTVSDFDFNLDNIAEDTDDIDKKERLSFNVISRSDLTDICSATANSYTGNSQNPLATGCVDVAQLKSGHYVTIDSVKECAVVELDTPMIQKPVIVPESETTHNIEELADTLRETSEISIQLTDEDNLEMYVKKEDDQSGYISQFIITASILNTLLLASGLLFLSPIYNWVGFTLLTMILIHLMLLLEQLLTSHKYKTVTYDVSIPDNSVIFVEDARNNMYEEQSVVLQLIDDEDNTKLVSNELNAEWILNDSYDSDFLRLFESIGFEKIDQPQFTATVRRSDSLVNSDHIKSQNGEWVIPVKQETNTNLSKSYNT